MTDRAGQGSDKVFMSNDRGVELKRRFPELPTFPRIRKRCNVNLRVKVILVLLFENGRAVVDCRDR